MTPVTCMAGQRVALLGLGGSGLATALALRAGGATVVAWDDGEISRQKAVDAGVEVVDLQGVDWVEINCLLLSPGIPLTHPEPHPLVRAAGAAGVEVIGDVELFCRERAAIAPASRFVAITGTNGKSTTTALIAHVLSQAGLDVQMGGNIGTPVLDLVPPSNERVHVLELSSFQIDLAPSLAPSVGILLNISPDHLDRHGTMENYAAIKERLVAGSLVAVVGVDDKPSRAVAERRDLGAGRIVRISERHVSGESITFEKGVLTVSMAGDVSAFDLDGIASLRGDHNAQNAAAAIATGTLLGLSREAIDAGLRSFPGLHHRMEEVGRQGRAIFINDSKATNADSTEKALGSFSGGIFWILGGKAKDGGIESLRPFFRRIDTAYLIGAASDLFAETLGSEVKVTRCGTLDRAVAAAATAAQQSSSDQPVVLLSPACASYDQYPNFEKRGDHFRDLVRALPGAEMRS